MRSVVGFLKVLLSISPPPDAGFGANVAGHLSSLGSAANLSRGFPFFNRPNRAQYKFATSIDCAPSRRVHVVRHSGRRRLTVGRLCQRAARAGERVQRRPQALGRSRARGPGGARTARPGLVVLAAVPEQRVRVLGTLQEQRSGHDPMEKQRPWRHRAAVCRPRRPLPGGPRVRVAGERHVPATVGAQPDQLRRRVDQTRVRPEHAGQVSVHYTPLHIQTRGTPDSGPHLEI